ncbi:MAG: hypothetical protein IT335_06595 [Thermomicrobiales bacterium]|nr:hypothetical protein [Thermomicrobiales bacterium]
MAGLRDVVATKINNSDFNKVFPGGMPGVAAIQTRIESLSQEEISSRIAASIAQLDQEKIRSLGVRLADYGVEHGIDMPAEVRSGDPKAIGQLLARTAKSEKGIEGTLRFLQLAMGGGGVSGAALSMTPIGKIRRIGLVGMLSDPKIRSTIVPIISGLFKK